MSDEFKRKLTEAWEIEKQTLTERGRLDDAYEWGFHAGWHAAAAPLRAEMQRLREATISEVATKYHGALATFFTDQGRGEPLAGVAEEHHNRAAIHRTYAEEIREQVWLKADTTHASTVLAGGDGEAG